MAKSNNERKMEGERERERERERWIAIERNRPCAEEITDDKVDLVKDNFDGPREIERERGERERERERKSGCSSKRNG